MFYVVKILYPVGVDPVVAILEENYNLEYASNNVVGGTCVVLDIKQ